MKRSGPPRRRSPLRSSRSAKRALPREPLEGELDDEAFRRHILWRASWHCEAQLPGCTGEATQAHHRYRPGRRNVPANGVALCASCHTAGQSAVHRNEAAAVACGLLIPSSGALPTERWAPPAWEWTEGFR